MAESCTAAADPTLVDMNILGEIDQDGRCLKFVLEKESELGPWYPVPRQVVRVWLCSTGGDVANALAIGDAIARMGAHVIATGTCQSAALLILMAGKKRLATPNTIFLAHGIQDIDGVPIADVPAVQRLKKLPQGHFDPEMAKLAGLIEGIYGK